MKIKLKFPFVEGFGDYHEIKCKADDLNEIFAERIKSKEIAFDGEYWGVFYVGKLPHKNELKKMLFNAGWCDKLHNSEFLGEDPHFS
jgi:hypothetical protein